VGSAVLLDQNDDKKPYFSTGTLSGEIGYPFNMEANNRILYQKSILKSTNGSKYCIDGLLCVDTLKKNGPNSRIIPNHPFHGQVVINLLDPHTGIIFSKLTKFLP
jgi:hypothetical protein